MAIISYKIVPLAMTIMNRITKSLEYDQSGALFERQETKQVRGQQLSFIHSGLLVQWSEFGKNALKMCQIVTMSHKKNNLLHMQESVALISSMVSHVHVSRVYNSEEWHYKATDEQEYSPSIPNNIVLCNLLKSNYYQF